MYIVDSHCDSLDLTLPKKTGTLINTYNFSLKFPQLQFVAAFCDEPGESEDESYNKALKLISAFDSAVKAHADIAVRASDFSDIERAIFEKKHAFMLTLEGAGKAIFKNRDILSMFYKAGARVIGLAWESNALVKSNRIRAGEEDTGLSEVGREVAEKINSLGMIFDVSHLSDKAFYDIAEISVKPIIASHSNFRAVCPHSRNLTDEMARLIFESDGMIGLNFYPPFISERDEWQTVEGLFRHLEYGLSLGGENHMGFGGDIDGTDGNYPYPLNEQSSMHDKIIELMLSHNYSESLVRKISGENYIEYLRKYL